VEPVVIFRELATPSGHVVALARLNSPKSLNALSLEMIRILNSRLRAWNADSSVACVVLYGAGEKGLCAGGDVRSLYRAMMEQGADATNPAALAFFSEEYRLDYRIHLYSKPFVVWANGIVMGGGLGLLAGASHRVVTESSRLAMPEIAIGLFPDVGGSCFLRRMPGYTGLFAALTGTSLNAHDAKHACLANHFLADSQFEEMCGRLQAARWRRSADDNHRIVSEILAVLAKHSMVTLPSSNLQRHAVTIDAFFAHVDLVEAVERIRDAQGKDEWLQRAANSLAAGSPTSASLIWELHRRALTLSLADVLRMELVVAMQCCAHPDFREGVRALLIEKDSKPRWTPGRLEAISPQWLAEHFREPVWPDGRHPLHDLN
jgi:enoyl-CoA hydratase/carnithine racemase